MFYFSKELEIKVKTHVYEVLMQIVAFFNIPSKSSSFSVYLVPDLGCQNLVYISCGAKTLLFEAIDLCKANVDSKKKQICSKLQCSQLYFFTGSLVVL